ncbi:MAG: zinc metallopeptidase [Chloroflexi bacterium]|nr:MAG: hypothetical protein CUN54_06475 [Phototrophicales bacterium]RMF80557.1 MAG: zinc metallopeptidase [Chloroflexota bacterium]
MFFFDSNYFIFVLIPTLVLTGLAQLMVRQAYSKWSKRQNSMGMTGIEVAERIMARTGLGRVGLEAAPGAPGQLTDHYDPRSHTVRLSQDVATKPSVASMAIVAHELGHAQQHEQGSILIGMRNFLVPAMQISPTAAYGLILAGLFFNATNLIQLGIIFFGVVVVFMILTLPVEFDASRRGIILLRQSGLLAAQQDEAGAKEVLRAAGLTYVAAAATAILQLLYYISLLSRRD